MYIHRQTGTQTDIQTDRHTHTQAHMYIVYVDGWGMHQRYQCVFMRP